MDSSVTAQMSLTARHIVHLFLFGQHTKFFANEEPVEVAVCKAPSFLETAAVILEPGDDFNLGEHALIVNETPTHSISGEAICFYRLTPADGQVSQRIYSEIDAFEQSVSVHHNNVLALPKGYHAELAEAEVRLYCLRISGS